MKLWKTQSHITFSRSHTRESCPPRDADGLSFQQASLSSVKEWGCRACEFLIDLRIAVHYTATLLIKVKDEFHNGIEHNVTRKLKIPDKYSSFSSYLRFFRAEYHAFI